MCSALAHPEYKARRTPIGELLREGKEHRTHIWDELKKVQRLRIIRFGEDAEDETEKQSPTRTLP
jgi:hypothetical protein